MALTPEGKVKLAIKKIIASRGALYCMPATGGFGKSGVSDFLICYKGAFISVEAKANDSGPTALQLNWLASVVNHGGYAVVINEATLWKLEDIFNEVDRNE